MTGHKTELIYRRYGIVDEAMLREGAQKLAVIRDNARALAPRGFFPSAVANSRTPAKKCKVGALREVC